MTSTAKDILVKPIAAKDGKRIMEAFHYSGKSVQNSQLHLGVFLNGKCHGAMQFGPPMDKRRMLGLVEGTGWANFLELNRMAFGPELPRNSESRALGIAFRLIRKHYPHVKWILSFSDATQCGDGAIYRASGFYLTSIKKNTTLLRMPDGSIVPDITLNLHPVKKSGWWKKRGATPLPGFQLRYIKFLDPDWLDRLTVPVLPFSKIKEVGASMYLGQSVSSDTSDTPPVHGGKGGATPTDMLQEGDC